MDEFQMGGLMLCVYGVKVPAKSYPINGIPDLIRPLCLLLGVCLEVSTMIDVKSNLCIGVFPWVLSGV